MKPLAEILAARDSSTKTDAIEVLLDCLEQFDAINHAELARTTTPIATLAESLAGEIELQQEKIEKLEAESAKNETRALNLQAELDALKTTNSHAKTLAAIQARLAEAEARLAAAATLIDSYSDLLAMARKFVTSAEQAGVKTRHVRPAPKKKGTVP